MGRKLRWLVVVAILGFPLGTGIQLTGIKG